MTTAFFALLFFLAWGVWSISGSLRMIALHNLRFIPPEAEQPLTGSRISAGDVLAVREDGVSRYVVVEGIADGPNGLIVGIAARPQEPS
jgi:hypothetical protein